MTAGTEPQTSESADVITAVTVTSAPHSPLAALVDVQTSIAGVVSYRAARIASFYVGDAWVDEPG